MTNRDHVPYVLTFCDDFDGTALDTARWATCYHWGARSLASNGEHQFFADRSTDLVQSKPWLDPFKTDDSVLSITARRSPDLELTAGLPYVSGLITTFGSFAQAFGRFEMRARVPRGRGLWPAFWLLPANGTWPPEIDVSEILGHDPMTFHASLHWPSVGGRQCATHAVATSRNLSADFHVYGVTWDEQGIEWHLDGAEMYRRDGLPSGLGQPMYMLAGLMVGGDWPGSPDGETQFPAALGIDWVRAWQRA
jgi:beta-glucanase (GH16 family)